MPVIPYLFLFKYIDIKYYNHSSNNLATTKNTYKSTVRKNYNLILIFK